MLQTSSLNWLAGNLFFLVILLVIIFVILLSIYVRLYVRIIPDGTSYRLYRKGVLIREGSGGTMVVRIPFLDRLETEGSDDIFESRLDPQEKSIQKRIIVDATIDETWEGWTTVEGVKTFFAPDAKVELRLWGPYEMYFVPDAPLGSRGGEGLRILSYLPKKMLSFEWNAPPSFPRLRKLRTWVVVTFQEISQNQTKITLTHCGWGEGDQWNQVYEYFEKAWDIVMKRCHQRFSEGPIDWDAP